jgi:hypothetical protein
MMPSTWIARKSLSSSRRLISSVSAVWLALMNSRETLLLEMPTVPAISGRTLAYLRVDTPMTMTSCTRSASRGFSFNCS